MKLNTKHQLLRPLILAIIIFPLSVSGAVLESDNFKVLDPVISVGGGTQSTSANFSLIQIFGEFGIGTSTASSFQFLGGFLQYPTVTAPSSVAASAGDGQAGLSWDPSSATGGWSVGGYTIGQATVSGGPYSYNSVGAVTNTTRGSLNNGTEYFFVIVTEDALGNHIATSSEVSATPQGVIEEDDSGGGGGGGIIGLITGIRNFFIPQPEESEEITEEDPDFDQVSQFDLNRDGVINVADTSVLFYCWGLDDNNSSLTNDEKARCSATTDFSRDGRVNIADLSIFLFHTGSYFRV